MSWLSDLIGIIGLSMLAYGLYLIDLSLALGVTGSLLIVLAVFIARKTTNDIEQAIPSQHPERTEQ